MVEDLALLRHSFASKCVGALGEQIRMLTLIVQQDDVNSCETSGKEEGQ
jgi:hypothetical protein